MPFDAADIAAFNDSDMPGYYAATLGAATVAGRFRQSYAEALGIGGGQPMFSGASSDLTGASVGSSIAISGANFTITAIEPDTFGQTVLRLQEA
jgi:hypothetical protein